MGEPTRQLRRSCISRRGTPRTAFPTTPMRSSVTCQPSGGRSCAPTRCGPGTPRPASSRSTSSFTATRVSRHPGRSTRRSATRSTLTGPGGAYAPNPAADWHLFVGDDSALPAIAAALESLASGSRALAVIEVGSAADEQRLASAADVEFIWLHRDDPADRRDIAATVRELDFVPGQVHAFVHGDAGFVRELRRYLRVEKTCRARVPLDFGVLEARSGRRRLAHRQTELGAAGRRRRGAARAE